MRIAIVTLVTALACHTQALTGTVTTEQPALELPCSEIQTPARHSQWQWQSAERALRDTGISSPILTMRYRGTERWTAHVILAPMPNQPQIRAVVGDGVPAWSVLCVTSEVEGCRMYGRLPSSEKLGWKVAVPN